MGFHSLLLINHDVAGYIDKDPAEFWRNAWHAINRSRSVPQQFGCGGAHPVGVALLCDDSDTLRLMLIGGGSAETLAALGTDLPPHSEDAQLTVLRQAADRKGYRLTKKPAVKPPKPVASATKKKAKSARRKKE